jgi:hypothetical protein
MRVQIFIERHLKELCSALNKSNISYKVKADGSGWIVSVSERNGLKLLELFADLM